MKNGKREVQSSFKIGDIVCDCRCKHLKIVDIRKKKRCSRFVMLMSNLVPWLRLRWFIRDNCAWVQYQDTLILEDGSHCGVHGCGVEIAKENGDCHRCHNCRNTECFCEDLLNWTV